MVLLQHPAGGIQDDLAAPGGHDPAHKDDPLNVVELGIEHGGMGQIHADVLEDLQGSRVRLLGQGLDHLQLLRRR